MIKQEDGSVCILVVYRLGVHVDDRVSRVNLRAAVCLPPLHKPENQVGRHQAHRRKQADLQKGRNQHHTQDRRRNTSSGGEGGHAEGFGGAVEQPGGGGGGGDEQDNAERRGQPWAAEDYQCKSSCGGESQICELDPALAVSSAATTI